MKQQLHPMSLLRHLLMLALVFTSLLGASAVETPYTIEFLTGNSGATGSEIKVSDTQLSAVFAQSSIQYIGAFTDASKAYGKAEKGVRLANADYSGYLGFSLSADGQKTITKAEVVVYKYNNDTDIPFKVTLKGDDANMVEKEFIVKNNPDTKTVTIDQPFKVKNIRFDATTKKKRCYVKSITLYYEEAAPVATPTFNPASGTALLKNETVTISTTTPDATIYYTTDESEPSKTSTAYTAPITITEATTIKAIAVKEGMIDSQVATASYTIAKVATPTFSPASGAVTSGTKVTISTETKGATIRYTIGGKEPDANSDVYPKEEGITITEATTIKAIAVKEGMIDSQVATASYSVVSVTAPTFSPESGEVLKGSKITISAQPADAKIYYTTDPDVTPSASSTPYTGPITINEATTINAIAINNGVSSQVTTASYTIAKVATPVFSPVAGEIEKGTKVTITTATEGATIYYSTDPDATPATISTRYPEGGIVIHAATTIKAIAVKDNMNQSEVATAEYTIKESGSGDENIITLLMNCTQTKGNVISDDNMKKIDYLIDTDSQSLVSSVSGSNLCGGTDYKVEATGSSRRSIRIGKYASSEYHEGQFTINLKTPVKIAKIVASISSYKSTNTNAPKNPSWTLSINGVETTMTETFNDVKKEFNFTPTEETTAISFRTPSGSAPIDLQYIEIFPEFKKEDITTIAWENDAYSCFIDEITQPKLLGVPDGVNVSYYVDNPSIANVNDNGKIIPYIPGMFTVTASWPETPKDETTTYNAGSKECLIELKSVAERNRQEGNTVQIPTIVIAEGNDTENDFKSSVLSYSITGGFWYIGYTTNLKLKLSTPETGASIQYHFDASDIDFDNNKVKAGTEATEPNWTDYTEGTEIPFSDSKEGSLVFKAVKNGVYSPEETLKVSIVTGVEDIEVDSNDNSDSDARYFNLQGVEVKNPDNGIFIRIANGKAVKVIR